jgi:hypothetical protein
MRRLSVVATLAVTLACCASAQAAPQSKRAYSITLHMYEAEVAVTHAQLTAAVSTVQAQLLPCLPTLVADANVTADEPAATALATELAVQYLAGGGKPVLAPELSAVNALAKLHVTKSQAQALAKIASLLTTFGSFDTCSDLATWSAASFASGSEPAATVNADSLANLSVPPVPRLFKVSRFKLKFLNTIRTVALLDIGVNLKYVIDTLQPWLVANGAG